MKLNKWLLMSGTVAATAASTIAVVSCGTENKKENAVTPEVQKQTSPEVQKQASANLDQAKLDYRVAYESAERYILNAVPEGVTMTIVAPKLPVKLDVTTATAEQMEAQKPELLKYIEDAKAYNAAIAPAISHLAVIKAYEAKYVEAEAASKTLVDALPTTTTAKPALPAKVSDLSSKSDLEVSSLTDVLYSFIAQVATWNKANVKVEVVAQTGAALTDESIIRGSSFTLNVSGQLPMAQLEDKTIHYIGYGSFGAHAEKKVIFAYSSLTAEQAKNFNVIFDLSKWTPEKIQHFAKFIFDNTRQYSTGPAKTDLHLVETSAVPTTVEASKVFDLGEAMVDGVAKQMSLIVSDETTTASFAHTRVMSASSFGSSTPEAWFASIHSLISTSPASPVDAAAQAIYN